MADVVYFDSSMTKNQYAKHGEEIRVDITLSYSSFGDNQKFLNFLEEWYGVEVKCLFGDQPAWSNIKIPLGDCDAKIELKFDVVEFDAVLSSVGVSRKWDKKNGMYLYSYSISVSKKVSKDNEDSVISTEYLKRTENDDGKGPPMTFATEIRKKPEVVPAR